MDAPSTPILRFFRQASPNQSALGAATLFFRGSREAFERFDVTLASTVFDSTQVPGGTDWLTGLVGIAPAIAVSVGVLALVVSGVALGVSISSRRLAGKSYRLAVKKEDRQAPLLDLELIEATQSSDESGDRLYCLEIRVTNRSETAASIRSASLWLHYSKLASVHRSEVSASVGTSSTPFLLPNLLAARSTVSGHLQFQLPARRAAGWTILSYDLVLLDTDSRALSREGISVNRRPDEA